MNDDDLELAPDELALAEQVSSAASEAAALPFDGGMQGPVSPEFQNFQAAVEDESIADQVSAAAQSGPISLADYGLPDLTNADLADAMSTLHDESSFLDELTTWGKKDIPYLNYGFLAHELYSGIQATEAVRQGSATKEQQQIYLRMLAQGGQDKTFSAKVGEVTRSLLTSFGEFGTGGPLAAGAARGTRGALRMVVGKQALEQMYQTRLMMATKALAQRTVLAAPRASEAVAKVAPTVAGATVGQQVIPGIGVNESGKFELFGGASGAWDVASVQRMFSEWDMTEDESKHLASLLNEQVPLFLESKSELYKGFLETLTVNTVEMAGVKPITKLPPFSYHAALQAQVVKGLVGERGFAGLQSIMAAAGRATPKGSREALSRVLDNQTEQFLEEIFGGMAAEAVVGMASKDPATLQKVLDALPEDFEQAAVLYTSAFVPAGVRMSVGTVARLRQLSRDRARKDMLETVQDPATIKLGETLTVESGSQAGLTGRVVEINRNADPLGVPVRDIEAQQPLTLAPFDPDGEPIQAPELGSVTEQLQDQEIPSTDPDYENAVTASVVLELPPAREGDKPQRIRVALEGSGFARAPLTGGDTVSAGDGAAATAPSEPAASPVTAQEYQTFVESGEVTDERASQIAQKIARGTEPLTTQELEMRQGAAARVEAELQSMMRAQSTPESREMDRGAMQRAMRSQFDFEGEVELAEGMTRGAQSVSQRMARLGIPVTFVQSADGEALPGRGFYNPGTSGVVFDVNSQLTQGLAYHEALHAGRDVVGDEWYSGVYNDLLELDPDGLRQAEQEYAEQRAQLGAEPLSEGTLQEEGAATAIERIGDYLAWVDSPARARHFAELQTQDPGRFQRLMDRLRDLLSRVSFGIVSPSERGRLNRALADLADGDVTAPQKAARILEAFDQIRSVLNARAPESPSAASAAQAAPSATQRAEVDQGPRAQAVVDAAGMGRALAGVRPQVGDRVAVFGERGTVIDATGSGPAARLRLRMDGPDGQAAYRDVDASRAEIVRRGMPEAGSEAERRRMRAQEEFDQEIEPRFAVPGGLPKQLRKANKVKPKPGLGLTAKFGDANVVKNLERLDALAEEFPDPLKSPQTWHRFVKSLAGDKNESIDPPKRLMEAVKDTAAFEAHLGEFSDAQIHHAEEGLELTRKIRARYQNGEMTPTDSGLMFVWAFLSRMLSAAPHESAFLMAHDQGIRKFIDRAAAGEWTEQDAAEYTEWLDSWFPRLSEQDKKEKLSGEWAAGARSNMNSVGDQFLPRVAAARIDGVPALQVFHQMLADPETSGKEVRRAFMSTIYASGMGNKLVSFVALIAGKHDVFVIDRWQARNMWSQHWDTNKPESERTDPYDGFDTGRVNKKGKKVSAGIASVLDGPIGIALYEGLERGMTDAFDAAYGAAGRSPDVGRYHWESWLWISSQEVGHASLQVFLKDDVAGLGVIEGREKSRFKGQAMVYLPDRTRGFVVSDSHGTPRFLEAAEWQRIPKGSGARGEERAAQYVQANGRELSAPELDELSWIPGVARHLEGREDAELEPRFAVAWHGSPHRHDKFSTDYIGTGEGAQVYGWGLYFASKRGVAEWYRNNLSRDGDYLWATSVMARIRQDVERSNVLSFEAQSAMEEWTEWSLDIFLSDLTDAWKYLPGGAPSKEQVESEIEGLLEQEVERAGDGGVFESADDARQGVAIVAEAMRSIPFVADKATGGLYRVDLAPKESEYLLWDAPLSEQSEEVRGALSTAFAGATRGDEAFAARMVEYHKSQDDRGDAIYRELASQVAKRGSPELQGLRSDQAASQVFLAAGIRGIKYLDGSSRADGEGSYNYVIFDDTDVSIEERFAVKNPTLDITDGGTIQGPWHRVVRALGDRYVSVKHYADWARERGASMLDDPESAVRRFFGKMADRAERIEEKYLIPLRQLMAEGKVSIDEAGEYVKLRHVPEANEHFARQYEQLQEMKEQKKLLHQQVRRLTKLRTEQVATRAEAKRERSRMTADGTLDEEGMRYFEGNVALAEQEVSETEMLLREAQRSLKDAEKTIRGLYHVNYRIPEGTTAQEFFGEVRPLYRISTSEARAQVAEMNRGEKGAQLKKIGTLVDQLNQNTRDRMREDGLLTEEQYTRWSTQFRHYVPMRQQDVERDRFPGGAGFGVSGAETRMRRGGANVENPLIFSVMQAQKAIQRGEKNQVGQAFYRWADANRALLGIQTSEVEPDENGDVALKPTQFKMKVDGRDMAVDVMDEDLARALGGISNSPSLAQLGTAGKIYSKGFQFWRSMVTSHNPAFMLGNFLRDVQTALLNTPSVEERFDVTGLRGAIKDNLRPAMAATWRWRRAAKEGGEWSDDSEEGRYLDEYRRNGGRIGMFTSLEFEELEREFQKDAKRDARTGPKKVLTTAFTSTNDFIIDANLAVETAARLALFIGLRKKGVRAEDAALAARQLTTDFNQTGEWGSIISSFYAFFSASIGGTRRNWQEWTSTDKAKEMIGGMIAYGMVSAFLNELVSDDDDDGLSVYSKMAEYEKARNMIFMIPGVGPIKIPMAYGWSIFPNMGRYAAEYIMGQRTMGRAAKDMLLESFNSVSPIASKNSLPDLIAPTAVEPFVQISRNENFMGSPIRPMESPFAPETARYRRHMRTTPQIFVGMAGALNRVTGGNEVDPGFVNLGGDDLEHIFDFAFGGAGKFWINTLHKTPTAMLSGDYNVDDLKTAPIIRKFWGTRTQFTDSSRFYDELDDLYRMNQRIKLAREAGDGELARELQRRHGRLLRFHKSGQRVKKRAQALRDQAYASDSRGDKEKLDQATKLMRDWLRDYLAAGGEIYD